MNTKQCDFIETMLPREGKAHSVIFMDFRDKVIDTNRLTGLVSDDLGQDERIQWVGNYEKLVKEEGKEIFDEGIDKLNRNEVLDGLLDVCVTGYMLENLLGQNGSHYHAQPSMCVYLDFEGIEGIIDEEDYIELLYVAQDILCSLSVDLEGAINEVLASNLSKFPSEAELRNGLLSLEFAVHDSTFDEMIGYQEALIENKGRYTGVKGKKVLDDDGVARVVFWSENEYGKPKVKYVKPCTFNGPVLNKYWK